MSYLPDRTRPRLPHPPRRIASQVLQLASSATWRALHPALREPYVERPRPPALRRLYYTAADRWQAPLFCVPAATGGAGEPVVLVHSLGAGHDAFRYGQSHLAQTLARAGRSVYLLSYRGDRDAVAPAGGGLRDATFSAILDHDLPAALEAVANDSGLESCHVVGHGLGGLLAMALAGRQEPRLASVTSLGAPLRFADPPSETRRAAWMLGLAPRGLHLPLRALLRASIPWVDRSPHLARHLSPGVSPASRVRGGLTYASADVPIALAQELKQWLRAGTPLIYDVVELVHTLRDARVPLLAVLGAADRLCPVSAGRPAVDAWGHPDASLRVIADYGHLDLLWGGDAHQQVFPHIDRFLQSHRLRTWAAAD